MMCRGLGQRLIHLRQQPRRKVVQGLAGHWDERMGRAQRGKVGQGLVENGLMKGLAYDEGRATLRGHPLVHRLVGSG